MHARPRNGLAASLVLVALAALGAGCGGGDDNTAPQTGAIQVKTATGGSNLDDSYIVAVDGGQGRALGGNDSTVFGDLSTARHSVKLSDRADNCTTQGGDSTGIDVLAGDTVLFTFTVTCTAPAAAPTVVTLPPTEVTGTTATLQGTVNPNGQDASVTFEIGSTPTLGAQCNPATVSGTEVQSLTCPVSGLTPATTYYYRITATNAAGRTDGEIVSFVASPAAGPSGEIAFESNRDGNYEVYVMNEDGSGQRKITNDPGFDLHPAWSPDRSKIAFSSTRTGTAAIFVVNADGTGLTQLTTPGADAGGSPLFDQYPNWSPDGTRLAFTRSRSRFKLGEIFVVNADGSGLQNLSNLGPTSDRVDGQPDWSPDASKILFTSFQGGNFDLWVMDANGSGRTNLTNSPGAPETRGVWSPNGTQIAFDRGVLGGSEVFVMNANGSNAHPVRDTPAVDADPSWSPDGSKIALATDQDGNREIYVMSPSGTQPVRLTNNSSDEVYPVWK